MLLNNLDDQIWAKLQKDLQPLLPENSVASFTNLIHRKKSHHTSLAKQTHVG